MKITSLGDGVVKCEIVTHNGIQNTYNTMHGGECYGQRGLEWQVVALTELLQVQSPR